MKLTVSSLLVELFESCRSHHLSVGELRQSYRQ